jgi:hypothetical protein
MGSPNHYYYHMPIALILETHAGTLNTYQIDYPTHAILSAWLESEGVFGDDKYAGTATNYKILPIPAKVDLPIPFFTLPATQPIGSLPCHADLGPRCLNTHFFPDAMVEEDSSWDGFAGIMRGTCVYMGAFKFEPDIVNTMAWLNTHIESQLHGNTYLEGIPLPYLFRPHPMENKWGLKIMMPDQSSTDGIITGELCSSAQLLPYIKSILPATLLTAQL